MSIKKFPDHDSFNMKNHIKTGELDRELVCIFYDEDLFGFAFAGTNKYGDHMLVVGNQFNKFTPKQQGVILEHEFGHFLQHRRKMTFNSNLESEFDADQYASHKYGEDAVVEVLERTIEIMFDLGKTEDDVLDIMNRIFKLRGLQLVS